MKRRPLDLTEYGISDARYKELHFFCQQYDEKRAAADAKFTLRSSIPKAVRGADGSYAFESGGRSGRSDPTAATADRREPLLRDVRMIEESAREADEELAKWILRFETSKDNVREIQPPCGERQFRAARKRFYLILHAKKCG